MTADPLQTLEKNIGHSFANRDILHRALCHSSHSGKKTSYERLEFLGDAMLSAVIASHLFRAVPGGNEGYLTDGSVQWMTAGRGVIHSEMPEKTNGKVRGFQLWLNLPKEKKMIQPCYNDIPADNIPIVNISGAKIKIISGTFSGITGPGVSHTGMLYYDISFDRKSEIVIPIKNGWNSFCYVYEGSIFSTVPIKKNDLALLGKNGTFRCKANEKNTRLILVAGMPLDEPVARGGPFVMNTREELLKAFDDYQNGRLCE